MCEMNSSVQLQGYVDRECSMHGQMRYDAVFWIEDPKKEMSSGKKLGRYYLHTYSREQSPSWEANQ